MQTFATELLKFRRVFPKVEPAYRQAGQYLKDFEGFGWILSKNCKSFFEYYRTRPTSFIPDKYIIFPPTQIKMPIKDLHIKFHIQI